MNEIQNQSKTCVNINLVSGKLILIPDLVYVDINQ